MTATVSQWRVERGLEHARDARRAFGTAVLLKEIEPPAAETKLRDALKQAQSAFDWLEDSEYEEAAHAALHHYGRFARQNFPSSCGIDWTGSRYEHRCPVAIAHKRLGFSIGFTAKRLCSICGADFAECPHEPGTEYDVVAASDEGGRCNVCAKTACTAHAPGTEHQARAISVIKEMQLHEVSIVGRPQQPDARLTAVPIDLDALSDALGPEFEPGMPVTCDRCLKPCSGVDRSFEESLHGDVVGGRSCAEH